MLPLFNGEFSDLFRDPKWVVLWLPFNCKKVQNIFSLLYDVGFSWKSVICELTIWRRLTDHPLWLSKLVGLFCLNVWSVLETRLQHVSGEILVEEEKHLLDFAKAQDEPYTLAVTDQLMIPQYKIKELFCRRWSALWKCCITSALLGPFHHW